jgi:hypothetical protein
MARRSNQFDLHVGHTLRRAASCGRLKWAKRGSAFDGYPVALLDGAQPGSIRVSRAALAWRLRCPLGASGRPLGEPFYFAEERW